MTTLFILFSFMISLGAQERERIKTLVSFEKTGKKTKVFLQEQKSYLPTLVEDPRLAKKLRHLEPGTEAFIEGYIDYRIKSVDNIKTLKPVFVIESIHPVSLEKIGHEFSITPGSTQSTYSFLSEKVPYAPLTLPVTTQVASTITLTSTLLMLESFSNDGLSPDGRRDMQKALIISGGLMATMLFIYDQIEGKTKP